MLQEGNALFVDGLCPGIFCYSLVVFMSIVDVGDRIPWVNDLDFAIQISRLFSQSLQFDDSLLGLSAILYMSAGMHLCCLVRLLLACRWQGGEASGGICKVCLLMNSFMRRVLIRGDSGAWLWKHTW